MDDFLIRAFAAGIGVAIVAGPLGAFVVWQRMAYFGETLAHAALLGAALGLVLGISMQLGIVITCLALAAAMAGLQRRRRLANDTLLGIFSHSALAMGLVALMLIDTPRIDIMSFLFGDILAVNNADLGWIYATVAAAFVILFVLWRPLLAGAVHEELAQVEGINVNRVRFAFMLLIALVIATAMKVVGILLIMSLLIIPAATARSLARSPEQMAFAACVIGCLAVTAGLGASLAWDLPAGPAVVLAATLLFAVAWVGPGLFRDRKTSG